MPRAVTAVFAFVSSCLFVAISTAADDAPASPLAGTVTSAGEGPMEGVVVSAQRAGSPITISVVVPSRQTLLSCSTTLPAPSRLSRSKAIAGRVT